VRFLFSHPTWRVDEQGHWQRADYDTPSIPRLALSASLPEHLYADWRHRLAGNLSRPSDSWWDPLTYVAADSPTR